MIARPAHVPNKDPVNPVANAMDVGTKMVDVRFALIDVQCAGCILIANQTLHNHCVCSKDKDFR